MKQVKTRLSRLAFFSLIGMAIWLLSLCSGQVLDILAIGAFAGSFVLGGVLCVLCFKRAYVFLLCVLICASGSAFARDREDCASYFDVSTEEGNWCVYEVVAEEASGLCSYVKSFNPNNVSKDEEATKLQENVNIADQLVQSYNDLDEAHQAEVGSGCHLLDSASQETDMAARVQVLKNNNTPMCCAWALQSLNQMHTAQYGERQVQTVPMMLADDKMQCWPCDVIYLQIVLANTLASRSAPLLASVAMFFLKWFFIFWILIKVAMLFLNRNDQGKAYGAGPFFQELLARSLCVGLVALILAETAAQYDGTRSSQAAGLSEARASTKLDQAYEMVINPAFEFIAAVGVELSSALLEGKSSFYGRVTEAVQAQSDESVRVYGPAMNKIDYCAADTSITSNPMYQYFTMGGPFARSGLNVTGKGRVIGNDLAKGLLCLTQLAFRGPSPIAAVGSILTSHAIKNAESLPFPLPGRLPIMPQLFYGLLLTFVCWLVGIAVAFRLIDIMLRVAMIVVLAPIFIATAAFPLTRGYAKKGLNFFVSALMGFVEVSIAVAIIVPFFYSGIAGHSNEEELVKAMVAPSNSQYVPNLYAQFGIKGFRFFIFICCIGWLSFKLLDCVQVFFDKVFGLQNIRGLAGKATMNSLQKDARRTIGAVGDFAANVHHKSLPFKQHAMERNGVGVSIGRGAGKLSGKAAGSLAAAGHRVYQKAKNSRAGQAAIRVKNKAKSGYNKVKDFAKNNKVSRGLRAFGSKAKTVGQKIANSKIVNNKLTRGVGKVAAFVPKLAWNTAKRAVKTAPSVIKSQVKQGLHQFFHPKD